MFDLRKKYFVITGAFQGNGKVIAENIIKNNGRIIAIDTKYKRNIKSKDKIIYKCDITSSAEIKQIFNNLNNKIKKNIFGLINNAGISINSKDLYDRKSFKKTLNVNLLSAINLTSEIAKILKKNKKGSIVNITSLGSKFGFTNNLSYQVSKNLLHQVSKSQASDLGKYNIRVNSVCPGYIKTSMTKLSQNNKTRSKKILSRTPLKRWGTPQDLSGAIVYLLSDASSFVSGSEIVVDGGFSIKGL